MRLLCRGGTDALWGSACRGAGKRQARVQEGEELTCEPFVVAGAEVKPMMEMVAGSNRWFQATVVRQAEHEVEVSFPRARPHPQPAEGLRACVLCDGGAHPLC